MSTRLCILAAAALALCKLAEGQAGANVGAATIGMMEDTFTIPFAEWDQTSPPECTSVMAGCTGEFVTISHATGGTITVLDDCTFRISQYSFDGEGPAVEWWADNAAGDPAVFPYSPAAIKVAELGSPGNYQTGAQHGGAAEVVVRLGLADDSSRVLLSPEFDHISLWCEDYAVDFGNAVLDCSAAGPAAIALEPEAAAEAPAEPTAAATPEAEAEGPKAPAEAEAKAEAPAAEAEAEKPEAEAEKPAAEAEKPAAEGEAPAEAEAKPEGAAKPVVVPITAPAPEPEAGTELEAPVDGDVQEEGTEAGDSVEASGVAGLALTSVGALAAGAALLAL
eukprot:jgi/Ulvmu1/8385/UM042_0092.1